MLSYFILTFIISWGGFIPVVGLKGFPGVPEQFEALLPCVVLAMLAGPSLTCVLLTWIVSRKAGLHELARMLFKWRVSGWWYPVVILFAPCVTGGLLFIFSLSSPIFTADDKLAILIPGILAGLSTVFEELGWTGFAVPRLRTRYSILTAGLIVGVLWGAWHFLQIFWVSNIYSGAVSPELFLHLYVLSSIMGLTAYRILLVYVYDRTGSLFVITLMHASLAACDVFVFRPETTGVSFLVYDWALAAMLWIAVALVVMIGNKHFWH